MAVGCGFLPIATGPILCIDLVVCCQKALHLAGRFEAPHEFLAFSGRPMRPFDPVFELLVRSVVRAGHKIADRFGIAAQLISDADLRLAKLPDQPSQKTLGCFRAPPGLHENVQHISIRVDRPLEPELQDIDRNSDFIQVPFCHCCLAGRT